MSEPIPLSIQFDNPSDVVVEFPDENMSVSLPLTRVGTNLYRLDAVPYLSEAVGYPTSSRPWVAFRHCRDCATRRYRPASSQKRRSGRLDWTRRNSSVVTVGSFVPGWPAPSPTGDAASRRVPTSSAVAAPARPARAGRGTRARTATPP